jgi:hypothetical protein
MQSWNVRLFKILLRENAQGKFEQQIFFKQKITYRAGGMT